MTFAKTERAELCDLLEQVGPDAPTLCGGWDAHDLAVHLWIRETDPIGAPGIVAKPLSGLLDRRMVEIRGRWPYGELVERIRKGPARLSVFAIPGVDEGANTTEYFVHHEDVRRAGPAPQPSRPLAAEVEEWMWRRLKLLARAWFRRVPVGVVLERLGSATGPAAEPETIRAVGGAAIVTLVGQPSELMLYAHGRGAVAEVKLVGEPESIETLSSADLHV
ncbi:TIGR03085 family metal-binding protein [uncultured Friedmanniella sp.]|uniref:TIGR03085 family metal-binding protein n=1 Tax=uncultured Friedmanniella sp. TaxID=335381 RepID=UPI0035CC80F1